jgi:hypothetical protein
MSLPKIIPLAETVALIKVRPFVLEDKPVPQAPVPQRPALPNRIAVVGNLLPRRCGIATFTTDLCVVCSGVYIFAIHLCRDRSLQDCGTDR